MSNYVTAIWSVLSAPFPATCVILALAACAYGFITEGRA